MFSIYNIFICQNDVVELDTRETGIVVKESALDIKRPQVEILYDSKGKKIKTPQIVNLLEKDKDGNYRRTIIKSILASDKYQIQNVAERENFIVAYAEGCIPLGETGYSWGLFYWGTGYCYQGSLGKPNGYVNDNLYLRDLIDTLADFGVRAFRRDGRVGVWVKADGAEAKIAALGVRVRRWVTFHGVSLNVEPELSHYRGIIPCGVRGYGVTSLAALGVPAAMAEVDTRLRSHFERRFGPTHAASRGRPVDEARAGDLF